MPKKVKHWRCLVNLAAPWVWGIGGNLELHCEIVIIILLGAVLKQNKHKTIMYLTQSFAHRWRVFHSKYLIW